MPTTSPLRRALWAACALFALLAVNARAADEDRALPPPLPGDHLDGRCIGPANMGGRITSLAVDPERPHRWWVATASGGLLHTADGGITFSHQFDDQSVVSIGAVAVAPSQPDVVWVGTGEANPRNSVSWGNGVYRSEDAGATWAHRGLEGSFQIGAIVVHPTDPDTVYVGALGRLWGPNEERGLFKTIDGGTSWTKVLHVDDDTGVVDVQMHPSDPETLLVATWQRRRDGFDTNDPARRWGPGSAIWKTTDAGASFRRIREGLPTCEIGRGGLAYSASAPETVYLVLETERIGQAPDDSPYIGILGEDADPGARITRVVADAPAARAGLAVGDVVLRLDGDPVPDHRGFIRMARRRLAGDSVVLDVARGDERVSLELTFSRRPEVEAGKGPSRAFAAGLGGQVENVQEEQGPAGHEHGGVFRSDDGGETWQRVNSLNPRPMYFSEIRVDPTDPHTLWLLGIRLWKSTDGGATFEVAPARGVHVDHHELWIDPSDPGHLLLGNDGGLYQTRDGGAHWDHLNHMAIGQFYDVAVDAQRDYRVYGGLQDNGTWGGPSLVRDGAGPMNADWVRIGGGDGFRCAVDPEDPDQIYFESQNGGIARRHLVSGRRGSLRPSAPRGTHYRFNWCTPFLLSEHNGRIYYVAGNHVFRSLDRGSKLRVISPDITATDRGSATALAESPMDPDRLYVGSDDGALWTSRDGGHTWVDLFAPLPGGEEGGPKAGDEDAAIPSDEDEDEEEKEGAAAPEDRAERARRLLARLAAADADGDGRVEAKEMPPALRALYALGDADHDGALDAQELRTLVGQLMRTPLPAPEAAPAPAEEDAEPTPPPGTPLRTLVPDRRWVSWIEPSRRHPDRVYLVLDGHRSDDDRPHLYASEDAGRTWRSVRGDLPESAGTTRVLVEDRENADLLYLGTEFGAWYSGDRGGHWHRLGRLPTVAVHAFAQHPVTDELVVATHGRSLWVLDVGVLRQWTPAAFEGAAHLFDPGEVVMWRPEPTRGAGRTYTGRNPRPGATIAYRIGEGAGEVGLEIQAPDRTTVRRLEASSDAGAHHVRWDLRADPPKRRGRRPARRGPRVEPGTYRAVLRVGDETLEREVIVRMDPRHPDPSWIAEENAAETWEAERLEAKLERRGWLREDEEE